jgi:hypothetical protein
MVIAADKGEAKPKRECDICGRPLVYDVRCLMCRWLNDDEGELPWEK